MVLSRVRQSGTKLQFPGGFALYCILAGRKMFASMKVTALPIK